MALEICWLAAGCLVLLVPAVVIIWLVAVYNGFVRLRNQADNAWAQIDVQTKKRYDLVPNLVETVKGYAAHEKGVFAAVTEARAAVTKAGANVDERVKAENALSGTLKTLFAVAEAYPDLKANQNFLMLQEELSGIENKIAYARQHYNDSAMRWNEKCQRFPDSLIAGVFGFKARVYYEAEPASKEPVKVKF